MPPPYRFSRFVSSALPGKVAPLAATGAALVAMGCLCLNSGCLNPGGSGNQNGTQSLEGRVTVPANSEVEIVYQSPFATPPYLQVYTWSADCSIETLTQQTERNFRIRNKGSKVRTVEWKARGSRVMTPPTVVPPKVVVSPPVQYPQSPASSVTPQAPALLGQPK